MNSLDDKFSIDDETLSAFLDAELPEADMERVRQRIGEDEQLSNRLAELAQVDRLVAARYAAIDARPLPESLRALLREGADTNVAANVVALPLWRRAGTRLQQSLRQHAALAAAITLAVGVGVGTLVAQNDAHNAWQVVAEGLEDAPSGRAVALANGEQLLPRLTFVNRQGQYCRQFQLQSGASASENIACRHGDDAQSWQLAASIEVEAVLDPTAYQTASGGSLLDSTLDQMMAGEALDAGDEAEIMENGWNKTR